MSIVSVENGAAHLRPRGGFARAVELARVAIGIVRKAARHLASRPRRATANLADLAQWSDARLHDVGVGESDADSWRDMRPDPWAHLQRWRV